MKLNDLITRSEQLITLATSVLGTQSSSEWPGFSYVDSGKFAEFRSASLSFIANVYGGDHPYFKDFEKRVSDASPGKTETGRGILQAVRNELGGGWLRTAKGLVAAELFADFLDMAQYLLQEGYKDAAAVLTGSVLEEHLRQLCTKSGIAVTTAKGSGDAPRRADALNADLAKASVYNILDQKNITAWLDLRNKAAHAQYDQYTPDQVKNMQSGVLEFLARVSP